MSTETSNCPLKVYFTNAQSLRSKVENLEFEVQDTDIMCIAESWLGPSVVNDAIKMINFGSPVRRDRQHQEYGGVCMYISDSIPFKHRIDLQSNDIELIWVEVMSITGKMLIGTIYRPPSAMVIG